MNRRFCVWTVVLGMSCGASMAFAQVTPTTNPSAVPGISTDSKGSPAISPPQKLEIDSFVRAEVQILLTGPATDQQKARDRLIKEAPGAANGITAQYLDSYANSIDQQVLAALKTQPGLRVRLNLAIVSARVAEATNSSQQAASVEALLNDPAEAVVLWGMKTAKFILPTMLQVQVGKNTLLPLMVTVALKYPGPVLDEAYQGLTLNPLNVAQPKNAAAARAQITAVIDTLQNLLSQRNAQWAAGVPKEPTLDTQATSFLIIVAVWNDQTPAQQRQTLQLMHDLLDSAQNAYGNAADKRDLYDLITKVVSGFSVVGSTLNDATLTEAVKEAKKITPTTPAPQVAAACKSLLSAVEALPQMQAPATPPAPVTRN